MCERTSMRQYAFSSRKKKVDMRDKRRETTRDCRWSESCSPSSQLAYQPCRFTGETRNGEKCCLPDPSGELLHPFTCLCFLLLSRFSSLPPSSPWNPPFFTLAPTLSPPCSRSDPSLFLAKVRLLLTLTLSPPHNLVVWTDGFVPFPLGKRGSGVFVNCSLCGIVATLFFLSGPVCSKFFR